MMKNKKFIVIDPSIMDFRGHYYEYAAHVLKAAEQAGYTPILVTNRRFKTNDSMSWETYPVYKHGFLLRLTEPSWYRLGKKVFSRVKAIAFRLKISLIFSSLGFLWSIRNQFGEYLRLNWLTLRLDPILLLGIWLVYSLNLARSLKNLLQAILPFQSYVGHLWSRCKDVFKTLFYPVLLVLKPKEWMVYLFMDWYKMRCFASDTLRLADKVHLEEDDIVLLPTMSTVEMLGLLIAFNKNPRLLRASWHLVFRRSPYQGEGQDYIQQSDALLPLQNSFLRFANSLREQGGKVYFYTDSEELTNQYNRLGIVRFQTLPIPHTRPFLKRSELGSYPLRIIYLGDARTEKGYYHLPRIVGDLWSDYVKTGRVVFIIQSNYNISQGEPKVIVARSQLECYPHDKVVLIKEPLSSEEYQNLLLSADINLLLYDRTAYYARSSGIFAESLSLGIPVIVPAGTWMARQLVGEIYRYHESLRQTMKVLKFRSGHELEWRTHLRPELNPFVEGKLTFGGEETPSYCWLAVPKLATHLLITFMFPENQQGASIMLWIAQHNNKGQLLSSRGFIVDQDYTKRVASAFVSLKKGVVKIWLGFWNALGGYSISISDIQIEFLSAYESSQQVPMSVVGLIYTDPDEISDLLREMIDNYAHYRKTAEMFAPRWFEKHNARHLVTKLLDCVGQDQSLRSQDRLPQQIVRTVKRS